MSDAKPATWRIDPQGHIRYGDRLVQTDEIVAALNTLDAEKAHYVDSRRAWEAETGDLANRWKAEKARAEKHKQASELNGEALVNARERVAELEKREKRLIAAAKAYRDLGVCYRVGKQPSETLWKRLDKAKEELGDE